MDPSKLFPKAKWHPGRTDQNKFACVVHAINMFVGGPLFDSVEKFVALYQSRAHMVRTRQPEHLVEHGISLKNFHHILYDVKKDIWYTPKVIHSFTNPMLDNYRKNLLFKFPQFLQSHLTKDRYLFQMIIEILSPDKSRVVKREAHAGAFIKDSGKWFIMDTAERDAFECSNKNRLVLSWLKGVAYLNIIDMVEDNPPAQFKKAFLKEWTLIMEGKYVYKKGRPDIPRKSPRNFQSKLRRKQGKGTGSTRYRKPVSEPKQSKIRQPRSKQLVGLRNDEHVKEAISSALKESSLNARNTKIVFSDKTQEQKKESAEQRRAELMKATYCWFEFICRNFEFLRWEKDLPSYESIIERFEVHLDDHEDLLFTWHWTRSLASSYKLKRISQEVREHLVATNLNDFNAQPSQAQVDLVNAEMQKLERVSQDKVYSGLQAVYIANPWAPRVIIDHFSDVWEKVETDQLRRWYWEEIVYKNDIKASVAGSSTMTKEEKKYYDKICKIVE
ncbi:hypothetical protein OXYTRIMIC_251 [Oxytricha trifallax]|uniref:Uncharacterized protein n=1 Tax=Oxytricha trifallax TaxID=1172189 RepID=A0A073HYH3_9SPIT|nr:hypothetical protein OXYTRIMIC_251 [Oxytricha trifallax]